MIFNKKEEEQEDEGFSFDRRLLAKQGDLITINHGSDESTATVAHLRRLSDGSEFVELSYDEVSRNYGSPKLTRSHLFGDRDGVRMKPQMQETGLGVTPDWFEYVEQVIDWEKYDSFVYELDHLYLNMFFCREIRSEQGYEYIFSLEQGGSGFVLETMAVIRVLSNDEGVDDSEWKPASLDVYVTEDSSIEHDLELIDETDEEVMALVAELLVGVWLKHGYLDEDVYFTYDVDEGFCRVFVEEKDFIVTVDLTGNGLALSVPDYAVAWLQEDGCPVPFTGDAEVEV